MDEKLVKNTLVACAAETAITAVLTVTTCVFCRVDVRIAIVATAVLAVARVVVFRGAKFLIDYRAGVLDGGCVEPKVLKFGSLVLSGLCASNLAQIDMVTRNVLCHEFGHKVVGSLVFSNARLEVMVTGLREGVTKLSPRGPGPIMGYRYSQPLMSAGGPLFALVSACGMIATAHFYGDAYDGFDLYLYSASIMSIVQHVHYALSAIGERCVDGHDFGVMARFGVDSRLWIVAFILLPIVVFATLKLYSHITKPSLNIEPGLPMGKCPEKKS
ncbi:MAG: hypothetical protein KDK44_03790 [Chlamydiia bacterium]|nr:hypothetical protein [Chlamydiia bacterium]